MSNNLDRIAFYNQRIGINFEDSFFTQCRRAIVRGAVVGAAYGCIFTTTPALATVAWLTYEVANTILVNISNKCIEKLVNSEKIKGSTGFMCFKGIPLSFHAISIIAWRRLGLYGTICTTLNTTLVVSLALMHGLQGLYLHLKEKENKKMPEMTVPVGETRWKKMNRWLMDVYIPKKV